MNNKRGCITAGIFAIAGFIFFATYPLIGTIPSLPGLFIVVKFLRITHEYAWVYASITNPIFYGIIGYLIGAFSKTRRQTVYITGLFAVILLFGFFSIFFVQEFKRYIRHSRLISQLKQQTISRLEEDPNDIGALHWMGVHHLTRTGQYQEAEKYFRKIVELESTKGDFSSEEQRSLIYLAIICQSWGKRDQADDYYQQFIATEPNFTGDLVLVNYNNQYLKRRDNQEN